MRPDGSAALKRIFDVALAGEHVTRRVNRGPAFHQQAYCFIGVFIDLAVLRDTGNRIRNTADRTHRQWAAHRLLSVRNYSYPSIVDLGSAHLNPNEACIADDESGGCAPLLEIEQIFAARLIENL